MTALAPDLPSAADAGPPTKGRLELLVRGARCAACMAKIESAAARAGDVESARLNLTTGKLSVVFRHAAAEAEPVIRAVEDAGYQTALFDPDVARVAEDAEGRRLTLALGVAGFGVGNVMMFSVPIWAGLFGQELSPGARTVLYWLAAVVAAPCALYAGQTFFASAWRSLRRGKANMDVPISIAVLLTLAVSLSETLQGGRHAYFDAAVSLLFLLLIGRWLDHQLRTRARNAARDLLALQAPIARRLDAAGVEHATSVREIGVDDRLAVLPGDRTPVDGVIEAGLSEVDNALITGETASVAVGPGARLYAGALNLTGRLVMRASAAAEDSTLANIARLIEGGAQSKSSYVRWADQAASIYVPVVHLLALATFLGGCAFGLGPREALLRAAAVLIVTCPCALGLAVPAVLIGASSRLFRHGVLVKSGAALERLAAVDRVLFDKTGVLTEGRPRLRVIDPAAIALAAPLARASRHPLAQALAREAGPGLVADDVVEEPGLGVEGMIGGRWARLGRAAFVGAPEAIAEGSALWFRLGYDTPRAFRFADRLRPDAEAAVRALKARGLRIEVLSGDVEEPVRSVARAIGAARWRAGLTPLEKVEAVETAQTEGGKALMVGDGLNDAAALAKAYVSMAPGAAVDASQNAADLVYEGGDLMSVVFAIDVARAARRRAAENFAFSAAYNAVAAPAAILGLVNPLIAALAMSASSLVVTLNAQRMLLAGGRR